MILLILEHVLLFTIKTAAIAVDAKTQASVPSTSDLGLFSFFGKSMYDELLEAAWVGSLDLNVPGRKLRSFTFFS